MIIELENDFGTLFVPLSPDGLPEWLDASITVTIGERILGPRQKGQTEVPCISVDMNVEFSNLSTLDRAKMIEIYEPLVECELDRLREAADDARVESQIESRRLAQLGR